MQHLNCITPSEILATGGDVDFDVSNYTRNGVFIQSVKNTSGTSPTLTTKLQESVNLAQGAVNNVTGATVNKLRAGATTTVKLSQLFTQSGARQIKTVSLRLALVGTITAGKLLTLDIMGDTSGSPNGTSIGTSATVDINTYVGTSYGYVTFTFAKPVDVADATVYHLVLSGDYTASTSNYVSWRSLTVASGGGQNTFDNTNWTAVTTEDFEYYTYQYNFTDVTGGGFTQVTTALTGINQVIKVGQTDVLKPILRGYHTVGGSATPKFQVGLVAVFERAVQSG